MALLSMLYAVQLFFPLFFKPSEEARAKGKRPWGEIFVENILYKLTALFKMYETSKQRPR